MKRIVLAITGATGSLYAVEFLRLMGARNDVEVHGIISQAGEQVLRIELNLTREDLGRIAPVIWHDSNNFAAPMSSGSSDFSAMAVLPCTMGSLGAIASGLCGNLIHRAADVMLKERRPLVLACRETPLNRTHLTNMLKAHEAGAIICPPMPAFYQQPTDLAAMARFFAGRVAGLMGLPVSGIPRWTGDGHSPTHRAG